MLWIFVMILTLSVGFVLGVLTNVESMSGARHREADTRVRLRAAQTDYDALCADYDSVCQALDEAPRQAYPAIAPPVVNLYITNGNGPPAATPLYVGAERLRPPPVLEG